jgi:autotransporter-associated beta strand protein/T5SS/PEP-CTERM-associated repeat protein
MTKHWRVLIATSLAALHASFATTPLARADIFQWEYINPADPNQGKQPSITLAADGAGASAAPGGDLSNRNLTMAYLNGANLSPAIAYDDYGSIGSYVRADLTGVILSQADLRDASFDAATLTGANLTGADVRGANFDQYDSYGYSFAFGYGTGITLAQLTSTASYGAHDLSGISLGRNDLAGANFAGFNLTDARFAANLTNANFSNANLTRATISGTLTGTNLSNSEVRGASLWGVTKAQLYSTASFQSGELTGMYFYSDQTGWNFSGKNLSQTEFQNAMNFNNSNFSQANLTDVRLSYVQLKNANLRQANLSGAHLDYAPLTGADLTGAEVRGADFSRALNFPGSGLAFSQLASTASYQAHDLSGTGLRGNILTGANLSNQNLGGADLVGASLGGANLAGADVRNALFHRDQNGTGGLTPAQLQSTASYQLHDLSGIGLGGNNLAGVNLAGQILAGAIFESEAGQGANLSGADLSHANLSNARLGNSTLAGATLLGAYLGNLDLRVTEMSGANLRGADVSYSNLGGYFIVISGEEGGYYHFPGTNLSGADLSAANLTNANFAGTEDYVFGFPHPGANLTNANLSGADARGANFQYATMTGANTSNLIQSSGRIAGLGLTAGASLIVRDYDDGVPIVVEQHLAMDATGTLRLAFDADPWDSTISFAPDISVALGGTLELTFACVMNVATQNGRTIDLFDWTGVTPTGSFNILSPHTWDLSKLYTTGEVTLILAAPFASDFNGDRVIDGADLASWRSGFGATGNATHSQGDANGDLKVDGSDFLIWQRQLGSGVATAAVPEPDAVPLLVVAASLLAWRRWRGVLARQAELESLSGLRTSAGRRHPAISLLASMKHSLDLSENRYSPSGTWSRIGSWLFSFDAMLHSRNFERGRAVFLGVLVVVLLPANVSVAKNWIDGSSTWSTDILWTPVGVPTLGEAVNIVFADGTARTVTYNVSAPSLGLLSIDLTGAGAAASTLSIPGNNSLTANGIYVGGYNGTAVSNGLGVLNQSAGTVTTNPSWDLVVGHGPASTGTYTLSGGALVANQSEFIGFSGTGTFNHTGGTNTVNASGVGSFDLGGFAGATGTYNLSGTGALTVNAHEYIGDGGTGVFNQTGGTNTIAAGKNLYLGFSNGRGDYNLSGGTLTAPAVFVGYANTGLQSNFLITGAQSRVNATTSFVVGRAGAGTLTVADGGTLSIGNGTLPLEIETVGGGSGFVYIGKDGGAGVLQASAVQFGAGSSGQLLFDHTGNHTFATPITGSGSVFKRGPDTTTLSATNSYTGITRISNGTLAISADANLGTPPATFKADQLQFDFPGGTLRAAESFTMAATRGIDLTGGGTIEVDAAKTLTLSTSLILSTGTVNKTGAGALAAPNLSIGTSGSSELLVTGGALDVGNSSVVGFGSAVSSNATLSGQGTTWTTGTFQIGALGSGTLAIVDSATLTVAANSRIGDGTATVRGPGSTWNTGGSLDIGSGRNCALFIEDQALVGVAGLFSIGSFGTVNLSGGTLRLNDYSRAASGAFNFNSGMIQLAGDRAIGTDAAIQDLFGANATVTAGKNLTVEGTANVLTTLTLDGGTLSVGTLENNGEFSFLSGTLAITQAGASINTPFVTGNLSTININANNISLGVAGSFFGFNHQGALNVGANAVTLNSAGYARLGVLTSLTGGAINASNGIAFAAGSNLLGRGAVNARIAGDAGSVIEANGALALGDAASPAGFNSAGELRTREHTVTLRSGAQVSLGNLTTLGSGASPGTLNATNGVVVDFGEAITGFGTVSCTNALAKRTIVNGIAQGNSVAQPLTFTGYVKGVGTFNNVSFGGTFSPGLSPTILTVGNISLSATNTLIIELGGVTPGSQHDQIQASGALALGGTLTVSLVNGFNAAAGNSFDILDWAALSGTFSEIRLPALAGPLAWNTSGLYTTGMLSVVSPFLEADFNENGVVNALDLSLWKAGFGTPVGATHMQGDANGDEDVDGADFLVWQRQLGSDPADAATAVIPEPGSFLLGIVAAAGFCRLQRPKASRTH